MKLASQLADYLKRWGKNENASNGGEIDPLLYLEHLASNESDDEIRQQIRELAETRVRPNVGPIIPLGLGYRLGRSTFQGGSPGRQTRDNQDSFLLPITL